MKITKSDAAIFCFGVMIFVGMTTEEDGTLAQLASVETADTEEFREKAKSVANLRSNTAPVASYSPDPVEVVPIQESGPAYGQAPWPEEPQADTVPAAEQQFETTMDQSSSPDGVLNPDFDPRVQ